MDRHDPDRVALVFGVMFTTIAAVSLADLLEVANADARVALGAALVLGALLLVMITVTSMRERRPATDVDGPGDGV